MDQIGEISQALIDTEQCGEGHHQDPDGRIDKKEFFAPGLAGVLGEPPGLHGNWFFCRYSVYSQRKASFVIDFDLLNFWSKNIVNLIYIIQFRDVYEFTCNRYFCLSMKGRLTKFSGYGMFLISNIGYSN